MDACNLQSCGQTHAWYGACMSSKRHLGHRCRRTGTSEPAGRWHLAHARRLSGMCSEPWREVSSLVIFGSVGAIPRCSAVRFRSIGKVPTYGGILCSKKRVEGPQRHMGFLLQCAMSVGTYLLAALASIWHPDGSCNAGGNPRKAAGCQGTCARGQSPG